jgi:hypothetical protein
MSNIIQVTPDYVRGLIEEEKRIHEEYGRMKHVLLRESNRMKADGYSRDQINEGVLDILKKLGVGFIQRFKYDIALSLLSRLGLDPQGVLARGIASVIEQTDIMEFRKYFSEGGCEEFAAMVLEAMVETGVEPIVDGFVKSLGVNTQSAIYVTIREALMQSLHDGELGLMVKEKVATFVCNFDVSDVMDVFKGTANKGKEAVEAGVESVTDDMGDYFGSD